MNCAAGSGLLFVQPSADRDVGLSSRGSDAICFTGFLSPQVSRPDCRDVPDLRRSHQI